MAGNPFPKAAQLARGDRYRRKVASPKKWRALWGEKMGPCRVCQRDYMRHLHHVVTRAQGGDDVADNLVPVCWDCHTLIHSRDTLACHTLVLSLTDAEYAYAVTKAGEDYFERQYGISYGR